MRRLLSVYADDARSLLFLWLSAPCWEIAAGTSEGRPEGGIYAILGSGTPPSGQALGTGPRLNKRYRDFLPLVRGIARSVHRPVPVSGTRSHAPGSNGIHTGALPNASPIAGLRSLRIFLCLTQERMVYFMNPVDFCCQSTGHKRL